MAEVAHSKLGASIAKRWMTCPGSVAACAALPEEPESVYAWEGTCAHALAQLCLEYNDETADGYIGLQHHANDKPFTVTQEMAAAVNVYLKAVYDVLEPEDELFVEQTYDLSEIWPGMFGTGDASVFKPRTRTLYQFDLKYGAGVTVEVEDNPQLKFYGEGGRRAFREYGVETIVCVIVQPRKPHPDGPVRKVTYDALDLLDFSHELRVAAARTEKPDAPRVAGAHCKFCRAARTCPALESQALSVATENSAFGTIIEPRTISDAEKFGALLDKAEVLRTWLKVLDEAKLEFARHTLPKGWKWVAGRGSRSWSQPELNVIEAIKAAIGADVSEVTCPSPAQVEKKIGKEAYQKIASLVALSNAAPSLVKESDKRAAIPLQQLNTIGKGSAFSVIQQPE